MSKDPRPSCELCISRRELFKTGAAGVALVALPFACGERPLPGDPAAGADSGMVGAGGAASGEGGALGVGGARGVGGASGVGGVTGSGSTCSPAVAAGAASSVGLGTLSVVGGRMVIGRDTGGLYAMSAICTHQGCLVGVVGAPGQQTLACPCHGSAFDGNGAVTRGPARTPLAHYQVEVTADGGATICTGIAVASAARTPLP